MKALRRLIITCLLLFNFNAYSLKALPDNLINFVSPNSLTMSKDSFNVNTLRFLSNFTTQKTTTYCGVASLVILLNSSDLTPPSDSTHVPYYYFSQEDFFTDTVKQIVTPEVVAQKGITLTQLNQIVHAYGLKSEVVYANDIDVSQLREKLKQAFAQNKGVIINFLRTKLGLEGGGHHSPLAAYDKKNDRFLVLDVARYKYPAFWVSTEQLWQALYTQDDTGEYRGLIIIDLKK